MVASTKRLAGLGEHVSDTCATPRTTHSVPGSRAYYGVLKTWTPSTELGQKLTTHSDCISIMRRLGGRAQQGYPRSRFAMYTYRPFAEEI